MSVIPPEDRQWILAHYLGCPQSLRELLGVRQFAQISAIDDDYLAMQEQLIADRLGLTGLDARPILVGEDR